MLEDLNFQNPQPPSKKSFSIGESNNSCCPYRFDMSNLVFNRFPQFCLYSNISPPDQILTIFSPIILDPLISLSLHGSKLRDLSLSRCPQLSLYLPIAPIDEIWLLFTIFTSNT